MFYIKLYCTILYYIMLNCVILYVRIAICLLYYNYVCCNYIILYHIIFKQFLL